MIDVQVVRWPGERLAVEDLRAKGIPRLLLLDIGIPVPSMTDCLEDWVRMGVDDADLEARRQAVAARAQAHAARPTVDETGVARFRSQWVSLSPVERDLASGLIDRYESVVSRELLAERAWPDGSPSRNAVDVHMLRLRRRVLTIGLEIRTVRGRGYLLQAIPGAAPADDATASSH